MTGRDCQVAEGGGAKAVVEAHGEVTDLTFLFNFQLFEKFVTNSNSIFQHTHTHTFSMSIMHHLTFQGGWIAEI